MSGNELSLLKIKPVIRQWNTTSFKLFEYHTVLMGSHFKKIELPLEEERRSLIRVKASHGEASSERSDSDQSEK